MRLTALKLVVGLSIGSALAFAAPAAQSIGPGLYAYISDNDASANATFLVGEKAILVVDTGLNEMEGGKLLRAIRAVSPLPVRYIVNTHYHPDHQGGNSVVGSDAVVITTDFTRDRTLDVSKTPAMEKFHFHPADLTFQKQVTLHLDPYVAEIFFSGKAHTSGDALVYFPQQHAIAMGDIFLNRSCPAMDNGSAANWIRILDHALTMPLEHVVPGHFELSTKADLQRFRDYMASLYQQVVDLKAKGDSLDQIEQNLHLEKFSDFRQFSKYEATFADNASVIYQQLQAHKE
ncbi:MAG TPA: MBL fold metallo-hydrolase [Terriglobales bacterium]|jgi:glyoxylase-like metal-dependent hydrolase (beta-lactamase superfamily II)